MSMHQRNFRGQRPQMPPRHPSLPPLKMSTQMPEVGKIKFYDRRRGFGFIEVSGLEDALIHASVIDKYGISDRQLEPGVPVRFSVDPDKRRRNADAIAIAPA